MRPVKIHHATRPTINQACGDCPLHTHCFLANPLPHESGDCADTVHRRYPVARDQRIYRRGARLSSLYLVCTGAIKTQREIADGGLVVTGFYLPGDIVGVDAIADSHHPSDAIAITTTEVCQLNFERLLSHCASKPGLHAWVIAQVGFYVRRHDTDLSWSTGLQAHRRVLRFFVDLHERLAHESAATALALPMRKQDIARYLHMTPETLSRNLGRLRRDGLLQFDNDRFFLPDATRARQVTQL
jgi:CRP/FNR family transcriptional regulator